MALFIHSQKLKTTLHRVYYLQSAVVSYLEGQGWGTTRDLDWLAAEPCRLSPNACGPHAPARPTKKPPFDLFFEMIPLPYFSFLVEKVGFSGGSTTLNGRGGRASLRW